MRTETIKFPEKVPLVGDVTDKEIYMNEVHVIIGDVWARYEAS